jgi:RNA polymerase sigma factor (sigma-70 family)
MTLPPKPLVFGGALKRRPDQNSPRRADVHVRRRPPGRRPPRAFIRSTKKIRYDHKTVFPSTRLSLLAGTHTGSDAKRKEAWAAVVEAYWKPVYKYIRLKWHKPNPEAEDLTQSFFAALIERRWLEKFDPSQAAFRTYLRVCLDGLVVDEDQARRRLKRGGGLDFVPLDFQAAERELALTSPAPSPEDLFHREWQRQIFSLALDDFQKACLAGGKQKQYELFAAYDLAVDERPTYDQLAKRFDLPVTKVTNDLAWARRELRKRVLERLAGITTSGTELRREVRQLFSV